MHARSMLILSMGNWNINSIARKQPLCATNCSPKLNHFKIDEVQQLQLEKKVKSISQRLRNLGGDSLEQLVMVDTIQRLGVDHLFQREIKDAFDRHYYFDHFSRKSEGGCRNGLHEVSLRFRLLRQDGYNISAHTFDDFIGQDMKFNEELRKDTQGLVSLFEASLMSMQGEYILDEANKFSKRVLIESLEKLDESHTMLVQNALKNPLQHTLASFRAHDLLSSLSGVNGWRNELQEIAKMEFNAAQIIYQNEILHISNWWKQLGLAKELKFARDQPLKWHMWSLAMFSDPSLSEQRIEITKAVSLIYIIDDIFDVYGTPEDLSLFTEAVNRWEFETLELPSYMKLCLKALFDVTDEISHRICLKYGFSPKDSLKKAWMDLINAFLVEFKWFAAGYLPSSTEYLNVATTTSGVQLTLAHVYYLLGGGTNAYEHNTRFLDNDYERITSSIAMILRLWDDLGSSEDEDQDGYDGSYIKCYINEREGVSIETAREHVSDLISNAWKSLNQHCMQSSSSMKVFTTGCLNLARMVPLMYSYGENHSLPDLDKFVTLLVHQKY